MEKTVFRLLEDSPYDVMEQVGRMNPKITANEKEKGVLLLEETYMLLRKGMNNPDLSVTVKIKKRFGDINLELVAHGEAVNPIVPLTEWVDDEGDLFSVNLIKANSDRLGYVRQDGANIVSIRIHDSENKAIYMTVIGILLGVILGGVLKITAPDEMILWLENNIASPIESLFMNAMMMMVPLVIFFSIINGLTHISETQDVGKIGKRMVAQSLMFISFFSFISVVGGLLIFPTEMTYLADMFKGGNDPVFGEGFSLIRLIIDIVPSNIVDPLKGQNILQVLFLALFFGIVINKLGKKARIAQEIIEFMDGFCLAVMEILVKFMPLVVFATTLQMVLHTDTASIFAFGKLIAGNLLLWLLISVLFGVIVGVYDKKSPTIFLKKLFSFAAVPLALRSSNAALPQTLKLVTQKFGVSPSLASFVLPVGTQLHLPGCSLTIALPTIMVARIFDKPFTPEFILSLFLYVFIFSYAMPPIPGGGIIAWSSVFAAIGAPPEAVMVFICVEPILDMGNTMINVFCNITSSVLLAKKFDMIDEKIYNAG